MSRKRGGVWWNPFADNDPYNRNPNGSIKHRSASNIAAADAAKAASAEQARQQREYGLVSRAAEHASARGAYSHNLSVLPKGGRRHHCKSHRRRRISRHRQTRKQRK